MIKVILSIVCFLNIAAFAQTISGTVKDADTKLPLSGILVTNGEDVVKTDAKGSYTLLQRNNTRFVSIVMPKDRKADTFYKRVGKENGDFLLKKRPVRKSFRFIQLGDTENDRHIQPMQDFIGYSQINDCAFIVHTGDICAKNGILYHAKNLTSKQAGIPIYYGIGNHDFCRGEEYGEKTYEENFGPVRYAFEEGNYFFLMTPMHRGDNKPRNTWREIISFVKNMLKHVPKDKNLIMLNHGDWFFEKEGFFGCKDNYVDLSQHNFIALLHGHTHQHYIRKWGKGRIISTGMSKGGGGGNSVGAFRSYVAKEDGTLTTELKELYVPEIFKISVSPKPNKDKKHLISASIYRTRDEIKEVFCLLPKNQKLTLKKVSPWQYIGYFKPNSSNENFTVTAKFASGKNATKKYYYKPQKKENSPFILRQVLSVPGTVYFGQPLVENNILYIAFEDESNYQNGGIAAFSLKDGEKIWQYIHGRSIRGRLTISQGNLYACDSFGYRIKLDSKTGKLLENKAPKVFDINYAGVYTIGNYIVSGSDASQSVSTLDGKILWQKPLEKGYGGFGTPSCAILDGKILYTATNWRNVIARDVDTGKLLWKDTNRQLIHPTINFNEDGNIILATGKFIQLLDKKTGKTIASNTKVPCGSFSQPICKDGKIFIGTQWDGLAAFDSKNLKTLWTTKRATGRAWIATVAYRLPTFTIESDPVFWNDNILISSTSGNCYYISPKDGKVLWTLPIGVPLISTPLIKDNLLIQADYSGRIFIWEIPKK